VTTKIRQIRIVKGTECFNVHGENERDRGVVLAKGGVEGIWDAPVKTTWKTGAFQAGSTPRHAKPLHRDMELGFHVTETVEDPWEINDSEFRKIFDYQPDPYDPDYAPTTIEFETEQSGVRKLDVLMYEEPEFHPDIDPHINQHGMLILKLRAGQPFWYETYDTATGHYETSFSSASTSASGTVTLYNPTPLVMMHKWIMTPASWTLPDKQWVGAKGERVPGGDHANRTIGPLVVTPANGGCVADLDRQELMFRDANDTNILAQFAGKFLLFQTPPYTPPTELPVSYTGAPPGGAMIRLVQPRLWERPFGQEL
jgi:hypothetical protein